MKEITKATWQEDVLDTPLTLVYFWAFWSRSDESQKDILIQLEQDIALLSIVTVNTDINPELIEEMAIGSLPTFILYKNGEYVFTLTGEKPRGVLLTEIAPFV